LAVFCGVASKGGFLRRRLEVPGEGISSGPHDRMFLEPENSDAGRLATTDPKAWQITMKVRLLPVIAGLASFLVLPSIADEQNAVDPETRQQIEAAVLKYQDACNNYDAAATATLFTLDAVEVAGSEMADADTLASGREAIEKRYATNFASSPNKISLQLVQVYAIGSEVCAISERSGNRFRVGKGYQIIIYVREADDWKIRMAYNN
jgi:ketosteroid isomerase-like protein